MKINKVWINKEGMPMINSEGWPETCEFIDLNANLYAESFSKAMDQAQRDAVPLEGFEFPIKKVRKRAKPPRNYIMDVDIEVEFVKQYRLDGVWLDIKEGQGHYTGIYCTRTVARVVSPPEKLQCVLGDECPGCDLPIGECPYNKPGAKLPPPKEEPLSDPGVGHYYDEASGIHTYNEKVDAPFTHFKIVSGRASVQVIIDEPNDYFKLSAAQTKIEELEKWKKDSLELWGPILDYCQGNSDKLGINPGESITKRILEILKAQIAV